MLEKNSRKPIGTVIILILIFWLLVAHVTDTNTVRHSKSVSDFAWHPSDNKFASLSDQDGTLLFWHWDGSKYRSDFGVQNDELEGGGVQAFSWHPSGNFLAIANLLDGLYVYDQKARLIQFIEYSSIFTFEWSQTGSAIALMVKGAEKMEIRILEVNTEREQPVVTDRSYRYIDLTWSGHSVGNFIKWISDDVLLVGTSDTSSDGRIQSVYLAGSGPKLNISHSQVFQMQMDQDLDRGLFLYIVENGSKLVGSTLHIYDYYEQRIIDLTTFDTLQIFTTAEYGITSIDPISKNLVSFQCGQNYLELCNVVIRDFNSLVRIRSYDFIDSYVGTGKLYWHHTEKVLARLNSINIQMISTETFELLDTLN
ncbi:MAG: hypothetical protein HeimC2_25980 [Candidatus Heimdallarchaeota archaeon LC_2]|nr:MAG: hypothetical protein HeimC2_25980 [Candidatus Heimdallarchaeota archaeon LC_2]